MFLGRHGFMIGEKGFVNGGWAIESSLPSRVSSNRVMLAMRIRVYRERHVTSKDQVPPATLATLAT